MSRKTILRIAVIVVAVAFIVFGVFRDEAKVVLQKGTAICFSCIGLG